MNVAPEIGKLAPPDAKRDAIHVAVAPVVAAERLTPGAHVGFVEGGRVGTGAESVGVVDPFLPAPVERGGGGFTFSSTPTPSPASRRGEDSG